MVGHWASLPSKCAYIRVGSASMNFLPLCAVIPTLRMCSPLQ